MTTNPERDGTRPNPHAGSPHTPAGMPPGLFNRDLPLDRDLPDFGGPRAVPEPPASPMRLDRMERVSFPPASRAPLAPHGPRQAEPHGAGGRMAPPYAAAPRAVPEPPPRRTRLNELEPEPDDGDLFPSGRHGHGRTQAALPYYGIPEPDAGTRSVPSFFEAVVTASRAPQAPEPEPPRKRPRIQWGTLFVIPLLVAALVVLYRVQPQPWQQAMLQPAAEAQPAPAPAPAVLPLPEPTEAEFAAREEASREQARRDQAAREQATRDQATQDQAPDVLAQAAAPAGAAGAPAPAQLAAPAPAPAVAAAAAVPAPAVPPTLAVPVLPPAAPAEQYGPPLPRYSSVVIRARASSPTERAEMGRIAAFLQPFAGRVELLTVQNTFRSSTVRYFYPEDAAAAEQLADELARIGEPWRVMSALPQRPVPLGRLEVWVVEN